MVVHVRRFSEAGVKEFVAWLTGGSYDQYPLALLADPVMAEPIEQTLFVDTDRVFVTTFELGKYLHDEIFGEIFDPHLLWRDAGLWAWLSLAFMGSLVKRAGRKGDGEPLNPDHYVAVSESWHAYRLMTRQAWWMVRNHGEGAAIALGSDKSPWGEIAENICGRDDIRTNNAFFAVATMLYLDESGKLLRGAAGQRNKTAKRNPRSVAGLGAMRRLTKTLNQFGVTYAVRSMPTNQIIGLLPPHEYRRWTDRAGK